MLIISLTLQEKKSQERNLGENLGNEPNDIHIKQQNEPNNIHIGICMFHLAIIIIN